MILTLMGVGHFISIGGLAVGIFAFYSGAIGLTRSYNLPGNTGRGQAIAGIILGAIGILLVIYIIATQGLYY
jgi:hypothetical protein